jgi:hypothetical protein
MQEVGAVFQNYHIFLLLVLKDFLKCFEAPVLRAILGDQVVNIVSRRSKIGVKMECVPLVFKLFVLERFYIPFPREVFFFLVNLP